MQVTTLENFNRYVTVNFKQIYSDPLIRLKKYNEAYTLIGPGLDRNGYPVTGLTEDSQEYKNNGKIPTSIVGTRKALEKELDLPDGTLKATSDYWVGFNVRIGSETLSLDLSNPKDLLSYLFLSAQSNVAPNLQSVKDSSKYEYVIYSEEQEAETRVKSRRNLKEAYAIADDLDLKTKMDILAVYGVLVDSTNVNTIDDHIDSNIEADPRKFLAIVNDQYLTLKSLCTKCLDKGILTVKDGAIYHGDVIVGHDKQSAAEAIAKDKTLLAILKAKLTGDMELISKALNSSKQ